MRIVGGNWLIATKGTPALKQASLIQRSIRCGGQSAASTTTSAPSISAAISSTDSTPRRCASQVDVGVERAQRLGGGLDLRPAEVRFAKQHLAVEVAELDDVAVDQVEPADAGAGERQGHPAAKAADADHHDPRALQPQLRLDARAARAGHVAEVAQLTLVALAPRGLEQLVVGGVLEHTQLP